ncbi:MAG: ribosome-binding factor A [Micavibrio sp.]|nr:ribosome-binding factor A [Micavibrio sp.]|tara:strand:- start:236608 stop:236982 length:375 start_codon:yes stop_codon:yes gene_type:complete
MEQSQRQLRVSEQVRHVMSETLRRGHFHTKELLRAAPTLSITEVRCSPDLKNATAFVSSLLNENMDDVIAQLNEESHVFQKDIGQQVRMKFTPKLRFKQDNTQDHVRKMENIFHNLPKASSEDE